MAKDLKLNLVLHGTWGIENNPDGIRLVTVNDDHHVFVAGRREGPNINLADQKHYRLRGVTEGPRAKFKPEQNTTVDPRKDAVPVDENGHIKAKVQHGDVRFIVDLPYPGKIHSVRRADTNDKLPFFETEIPRTPEKKSAVQVLVYDVPNSDNLEFHPLQISWEPLVKEGSSIINFHLFAEPDSHGIVHVQAHDEAVKTGKIKDRKEHFKEVFEKLGKVFGLEMTPASMIDIVPTLEEEIDGLTKADTAALFEHGARAAVSPANCDMCVFDNLGDQVPD